MQQTSARPITSVIWDPALLGYRFNASHPMDPVRLDLTERLCRELGVFEADNLEILAPEVADDDALLSVHAAGYLDAVRIADEQGVESPEYGLGTEDTPVFAGLHEGAARIAGGTLSLARKLAAGEIAHGVNFAGGMHHAARAKAGGFCVYNDAAVGIQYLLENGFDRVVYLDVDAHHGDGTQDIFYNDPRVMTISLHQSGVSIYPGTGFANETGGPDAPGTAVNIALPENTGDAGWLRAFHAVVPQIIQAFEPQVIVSQHGCDSHALDPLADLKLSIDAQRQTALDIAGLAAQYCQDRWIATGGGGYSVYEVVPRSWAHLTAIVAGCPIPLSAEVPALWAEHLKSVFDVKAPKSMGDDAELWWRSWELGYDPEDVVDRVVMAVRKEVFPLYALDPWFD